MIKQYFIYIMGAAYILAGLNHFWRTSWYVKIMPPQLPAPATLVYISGLAEVLCGAGMMVPATRKFSAWSTIALLIAIFPANIYMAMHPGKFKYPAIFLYLRLPLQLVLIWLAYIYTHD